MKIISAYSYPSFKSDAHNYEVLTETGVLRITKYNEVPDRYFVAYTFAYRDVLRILDRMDRTAWHRIWTEFRQLQD